MKLAVIIPKRHQTFARCMEELLRQPERAAFQSDLKHVVYSKSWREVVKPEILLWNKLIEGEFPGRCLIVATPMKNPRTGKSNEVLFQIHPKIDLLSKADHYLAIIK